MQEVDGGSRMQDLGCGMSDVKIQDTGHGMKDLGCRI